jgi:hypothetical protein
VQGDAGHHGQKGGGQEKNNRKNGGPSRRKSTRGQFFKRNFAPTEKLAPTVGAKLVLTPPLYRSGLTPMREMES